MLNALPSAQALPGLQAPATNSSEGSVANSPSGLHGGGEQDSGFSSILESSVKSLRVGKTAGGEGPADDPSIAGDLSQEQKTPGTDKDSEDGTLQLEPALLAILKSIVNNTGGTETETSLPISDTLINTLQEGTNAEEQGDKPSIVDDLSRSPKTPGTDKDSEDGTPHLNPALLAILKSIVSNAEGTETENPLPTSDTKDVGKTHIDKIPTGFTVTEGKGGEPAEKTDLLMQREMASASAETQPAKGVQTVQTMTEKSADRVFPSYLKETVTRSDAPAGDGQDGVIMHDDGGSGKTETGQLARSEHLKPQDSPAWKGETTRIENPVPHNARGTDANESAPHEKGDTNAIHNQDGYGQENSFFTTASHHEIAGQPVSRPEIPTPVAAKSAVSDISDNRVYVMKDSNTLVVTLEPEGLGKLDINLSLDRGMINAQINVSDSAVRTLIEKNVEQIIHTLLNEGISVGGFSVALRDGQEPGSGELEGRALQEGTDGTAGESREVSAMTYGTGLHVGKGRINLYI